jgi:hypothetical protein
VARVDVSNLLTFRAKDSAGYKLRVVVQGQTINGREHNSLKSCDYKNCEACIQDKTQTMYTFTRIHQRVCYDCLLEMVPMQTPQQGGRASGTAAERALLSHTPPGAERSRAKRSGVKRCASSGCSPEFGAGAAPAGGSGSPVGQADDDGSDSESGGDGDDINDEDFAPRSGPRSHKAKHKRRNKQVIFNRESGSESE